MGLAFVLVAGIAAVAISILVCRRALTGRRAFEFQLHRPASTSEITEDPRESERAGQLPSGSRLRPIKAYSPTMADIEQASQGLRQVPPLPKAVLQIMRELDSESASAASVARIVSTEPVLAASLLRIANSAASGLRREIVTLAEAVAYLGFSTTKSLLLRLKLSAMFPAPPLGCGYDPQKLWVHSVAVAQVAEELSRRAGSTDPQLALTAGLLHDIGKLAINGELRYQPSLRWSPGGDPAEGMLEAEHRIFGANHAFIGAALAEEWNLPRELVRMIRLHHHADDLPSNLPTDARRALLAIHVANQLVKHRHVYCQGMEIDTVPASITSELRLADFAELQHEKRLRDMIARALLLNGAASSNAKAA